MPAGPEAAPTTPSPWRYWAFISYSHRDTKFVQWLHAALETYRVPRALVGRASRDFSIPRRLLPIFRDRDELPSAGSLTAKVREALEASRTLIVVCSPAAAASPWVNQEICLFKQMGRADRVFPIIIAGEPNASDDPESGLAECFPSAVRFVVSSEGQVTLERAEPIAADAREGRDEPEGALLKLVAGILDIGFDDLRRRETIRRRRQKLVAACKVAAACVGLLLAYTALADADLALPGSGFVRQRLDRYGLSIFRPVGDDAATLARGREVRENIRARMTGPIPQNNPQQGPEGVVWEIGQVVAAVYREPESTAAELALLPAMVDRVFEPDILNESDGALGWHDGYPYLRAETPLWMLIALAAGLRREGALDRSQREAFLGFVNRAQLIADRLYPLDETGRPEYGGGWKIAVDEHRQAYVYSSALALHALLDLQAARVGWHGDPQRLEQMIADVYGWLVGMFVDNGQAVGWQREKGDDKPPDRELTIFVCSALLRASFETGRRLPGPVSDAALHALIELWRRPYMPSHGELLYKGKIRDPGATRARPYELATRILWHPWAVVALQYELKIAERDGLPRETRRGLKRSLSHLLVTLSGEMERDILKALPFAQGEVCYALSIAE